METEKRLIDANAYCKELYEERDYPGRTEEFISAMEVAIADLGDMPTVDAIEVVHGEWANVCHAVVDTTGYCTRCGEQAVWRTRNKPYTICPNCGAKMDGGNEDG